MNSKEFRYEHFFSNEVVDIRDPKHFRWYEGANPFGPGHNQSVEGINKSIKENQIFRLKLLMGELFNVTLRLVSEQSKVINPLYTSLL